MSTKIFRRVLSVFLTAIILGGLIPAIPRSPALSSSAAPAKVSGGSVRSSAFNDGDIIANHDSFKAVGDSVAKLLSNKSGKCLQITSPESQPAVSAVFDDVLSCNEYGEVGVYITAAEGSDCKVTLTVVFDQGSSTFTASIPNGEEYYVFVSIPETASYVTEITVNAKFTLDEKDGKDASESKLLLKNAVFSLTDHSTNSALYSAFDVTGIGEDSRVTETSPVTGSTVLTDAKGDILALIAEINGSAGGVTLHWSDDGEEYNTAGSALIAEGRSYYIFRVGTMGKNSSYKLEFTGLGEKSASLTKISFISMESRTADIGLGLVSKCFIAEDTGDINLSGTITRDTVVEHINGEICVFEIPSWDIDSAHLYSADPIATADMSTSFSFTLPLNKDHSVFSAFVVAVRDGGKLYPLADPIFPSRGTMPEVIKKTSSVSGVSCENAFSSGFDNYVIDIDIQSLFHGKSTRSSTVFTFDGKSYYPDKDIISEIDRKTKFLSAAGIGVIFNITHSEDPDIFRGESEDDCRTVAAVTSFLSGKYSPGGFIVPTSNINENLSDAAYCTAELVRLVSSAAGSRCTVYTVIPEGNDDELFTWLLSSYISDMPKMNCELLLSLGTKSDVSRISAIESCASAGGYDSKITVLLESAGGAPPSLATEIAALEDRSYMLRITDGVSPEPSDNFLQRAVAVQDTAVDSDNGSVILWDFTASYDSDGFTVSPDSTGIFTVPDAALEEFLGVSSCRVLKTTLNGDARVLLATPDSPMKLTDCPEVRLLMSCNANAPFSLDIIFISGNRRMVFTAKFDKSGVYSTVCDLSDTEIKNKIDRIALVLRDGDHAELGIAKVSASGEEVSSNAASTIYITEAVETTDIPDTPEGTSDSSSDILFVYIGIIAAATVIVFAALSIKKA